MTFPRREICAAALLAASLFLYSCTGQSATAPKAPPLSDVGMVPVVEKDVPIYSDWVATMDGFLNANIEPQVSGYLIKQNYREGSFVHKDDVLFEIDPRPFQAVLDQAKAQVGQARGQLAQAQAQLGLSEINVKRDTPLAAARAIAQSQLDNDIQGKAQAEAQVKTSTAAIASSEANVETAELNLGFTKVRSLIDGIAGIAAIQIGNLVSPTTVLTTVSQVNPIKVIFPISEQEYLSLAGADKSGTAPNLLKTSGQAPLQLTLSNGAVYPQNVRMLFSDRQVDSQTGTIRIVSTFPNPGNVLRPGQFGRVRALVSLRKDALLVPQRAVSELQGRYQVAVVGPGNKISVRFVKVGDRVDDLWIVTDGLHPGENVVSEGVAKVRDGAVVNPKSDRSGVASTP